MRVALLSSPPIMGQEEQMATLIAATVGSKPSNFMPIETKYNVNDPTLEKTTQEINRSVSAILDGFVAMAGVSNVK